ncbi:MAG: sigma-70 family RNA polymerase sigma factor [Niastella sp.]|nr:sigma-70 family RNA polymerase sigma factor [Niastella sp.]
MNNRADGDHSKDRWLCAIYEEAWVSLITYAYTIIRSKEEAEDVVGESFAKLANELVVNKEKFPTPANAKAYLVTIVRNACFDWNRKKKPVSEISAETQADDSVIIFEFEKYDLAQQLLTLIDELPPQSKQVITLFFIHGLSTTEVAKTLNLSREVVSVYKHRAISHLQKLVKAKKIARFLKEPV